MNMKKLATTGLCCSVKCDRKRKRDGKRHYRSGYLNP